MTDLAHVKVEGVDLKVPVPITSGSKPDISERLEDKWQRIIDFAARIMKVPSALIMRLDTEEIEVFLRSDSEANPYEPGERAELLSGLYCETVVGQRRELLVPNALVDQNWKDNPDVKLNMVSYLGLPLMWPDGEVFGTICVLDDHENHYSEEYRQLLAILQEVIEKDLQGEIQLEERGHEARDAQLKLREIQHRIKNELNLLISFINIHGQSADGLDDTENIVEALKKRLFAIAQAHESLSRRGVDDTMTLKSYLRGLTEILSETSPFPLQIIVQGTDHDCSGDQLPALGLIINELIANSIKHAFTGVEEPSILIEISAEKDAQMIIRYTDNGAGQADLSAQGDGLGMLIIEGLLQQINAVSRPIGESGHGLEFRFNLGNDRRHPPR